MFLVYNMLYNTLCFLKEMFNRQPSWQQDAICYHIPWDITTHQCEKVPGLWWQCLDLGSGNDNISLLKINFLTENDWRFVEIFNKFVEFSELWKYIIHLIKLFMIIIITPRQIDNILPKLLILLKSHVSCGSNLWPSNDKHLFFHTKYNILQI